MIAIRNAYTNWLLRRNDLGELSVEPPGEQLSAARWQHDTPAELTRFSDPANPGSCLNLGTGELTLSTARSREPSALWILVPIEGTDWVRIKSRSHPDFFLNTEHGGKVGAGPIEPGWMSAMWSIDEEVVRFGVDEHLSPPTVFVHDARSVHLRYAGSGASAMYNEVTATTSQLGTYFMAVGFEGGYAGFQEKTDGSKIAIFSVWDNKRADGVVLPTDVVRASADPVAFPPEGGGGQSVRVALDWELNEKVAFAVTAEPDAGGTGTNFTGYFRRCCRPGVGDDWFFMATFHRPGTGGALLGGLYAFVEDFRRNGADEGVVASDRSPYQHHVAKFSNPRVRATDGTWTAISDATFTAFSGSPRNPLLNIDATVVPGPEISFQLATGGFWVQHTALGTNLRWETGEWPSLPS